MDQVTEAAIELPRHYIEIEGSLVHGPRRSLKHGEAFAVFDDYGDIGVIGTGPEGLYFNDTRFLSRYDFRFEGKRPLLLGSVIEDDNVALSVGLANPDISTDDTITLSRGSIAIERTKPGRWFITKELAFTATPRAPLAFALTSDLMPIFAISSTVFR